MNGIFKHLSLSKMSLFSLVIASTEGVKWRPACDCVVSNKTVIYSDEETKPGTSDYRNAILDNLDRIKSFLQCPENCWKHSLDRILTDDQGNKLPLC